ncbi:MAG: ferric reductase-like transmembrane domain-containing protein [Methyloceanibacter sp.]
MARVVRDDPRLPLHCRGHVAHADRPDQRDRSGEPLQRAWHRFCSHRHRPVTEFGTLRTPFWKSIDRTMGFHRIAAYVLLALALLHPLSYAADTLLADPIAAWHRLIGMLASPRLRSGTLSMAGLIVIVGLATVRSRPFIRYEYWRASHGLLAIAVAALTLHPALASGTYSAEYPLRVVWFLFATLAVVAIVLVYIVRPWRMWRENWWIERVSPLAARCLGNDLARSRRDPSPVQGRAVYLADDRAQSATVP